MPTQSHLLNSQNSKWWGNRSSMSKQQVTKGPVPSLPECRRQRGQHLTPRWWTDHQAPLPQAHPHLRLRSRTRAQEDRFQRLAPSATSKHGSDRPPPETWTGPITQRSCALCDSSDNCTGACRRPQLCLPQYPGWVPASGSHQGRLGACPDLAVTKSK